MGTESIRSRVMCGEAYAADVKQHQCERLVQRSESGQRRRREGVHHCEQADGGIRKLEAATVAALSGACERG